jgi:hypothetical protein
VYRKYELKTFVGIFKPSDKTSLLNAIVVPFPVKITTSSAALPVVLALTH